MTMARLSDVKMVLYAPVHTQSRRKATGEAEVAYLMAKHNFEWRATPATWSRLVAASRQLHAIVKAERADRTLKQMESDASLAAKEALR